MTYKQRGGLSLHPLYGIWWQMCRRCADPAHPMYRWYGARGISVCGRWRQSFNNFYDDMAPRPKGLTLERRDNDGPYSPSNCEWATRAEQAQNRAPMGTYLTAQERKAWKEGMRRRIDPRRVKLHPCEHCGIMFKPFTGAQRFCSSKCRGECLRQPDKRCQQCGVTFRPKRTSAIFCGRACRGLSQRK